jgi:hypothetical protein
MRLSGPHHGLSAVRDTQMNEQLEWIIVCVVWGWAIGQFVSLYLAHYLLRDLNQPPAPVDPKVTEAARKNFEEMARLGLERYRVLKGNTREYK